MTSPTTRHVQANPYAWPYNGDLRPDNTALIVIDMQRDFAEPGGFGASLGNDVSRIQAIVPAVKRLLIAGLTERWGVYEPKYNLDIEGLSSRSSDSLTLVARSAGIVVGTGSLRFGGARRARVVRMSTARERRRQLLLALKTGQGDQGADEQADRNDHGQQLRHREQGQLDHDPDALTAFDDDFQLVEALAQNAYSGQRGARAHDGAGDLPEKIALNQGHMRREITRCGRRRGGASNTHPNAPAKPGALIP